MKTLDWKALFEQYKFMLLVIGVGVFLLLLPTGSKGKPIVEAAISQEHFDLPAFEEKLGLILSNISGAGQVEVILTVTGTTRQVFAQDNRESVRESGNELTESTVVVSKGSGAQEALLVETVYPKFQGAVVVCDGGNDPAVKLKLIEAVSALTGLGADKISVCMSR